MKKIKSILLFVLFVTMVANASFASNVSLGGKNHSLTMETSQGRAYVLTDDLKAIGLSTQISGRNIKLFNNQVVVEFVSGTNKVKVNGTEMTLDTKAYIKNGKAYVPLRFIFETMNYNVGYNSRTQKITLDSKSPFVFPVVIKDGDVSYQFIKPVKSIVSLAPSITEILFAIGADDLLVGRTNFCDYPSQVSSIQTVGTLREPDIEGILDLTPELVIAATHMNEDAMNMFQRANIQIATQKSPDTLNQIYVLIENLGKITGKNYEARALVSSLKAKEQRVENVVSRLSPSQKKTMYYVVGTGQREFTAGADTFIHQVMTKSGAINVARDVNGWAYTLEKLIDHNPEFIFGEQWAKDTMTASNNYSSLRALKSNGFVVVDGNVFSRPGPRIIDQGMKKIVNTLYPQFSHQLNY